MGQRVTFLIFGCVLAVSAAASAQTFTISSKTSDSGPAAKEFAAEVIGDPWDFNEASDYVYTYSLNDDGSGGPAFNAMPDISGGVLHGIVHGATPKVCIQHEGIPGAFNLVGRNGIHFPIDASRFRRLSFRMKRAIGAPSGSELIGVQWMSPPGGSAGQGLKYGTITGSDTNSKEHFNQAPVASAASAAYHIYVFDLDVGSSLYQGSWSGAEGGIYLKPGTIGQLAGTEVDLDWIRLSERGTVTKHLAWNGFSNRVTLTATNAATGDAIQIFGAAGATDFAASGSIDWDYGFLPAGTWTITATSGTQSKAVTMTIDAAPVINVTEPDATGGQDYATNTFADAWDLTNPQDLRFGQLHQIGNQSFTENGLEAITQPLSPPDPFVQLNGIANNVTIDANRYHRFSFTILYDHPELLSDILSNAWGGICRVIWNQGGDYRVTQDIVPLGGIPNTFVMDLATLSNTTTQIEDQGGHPGPAWAGAIQNFWIRVLEGTNQRWFRLSNLKLAADDEPNGNGFFTIKWRVADNVGSNEIFNTGGSDATVALYYDTDTDASSGAVLFASGLNAAAGQYSWDVSALPAGKYYVLAVITDAAGNTQSRYSTGPVSTPGYPAGLRTDANKDGLPDAWQAQYGGITNPDGDDDGDGILNKDEYALGTNPLIPNTLSLSEGATGFFTERLALANPDSAPADVTLTFLRGPGSAPISREYTLPPYGRSTIKVNDIAGLGGPTDVSTVISANTGGVVAERTMMWGDNFYGGSTGKAIDKARQQWFLAEGVANSFFDTFVLLANATGTPANVTLHFLRDGATPVDKTFAVPATSRITVYTNQIPELLGYSFSTQVTSDVPITVERSTYFTYPGGRSFEGGTEDAAIPSLSTTWYLAEGQSSGFFSEFILLGNPNSRAATVTLKYLMPGGATVTQTVNLAASSRQTIQVNDSNPANPNSPWNLGVRNTDVSVAITSDLPIAVERAMYWPGGQWTDGHSSSGLTTQGTIWALAEGESGGAMGFESYILFANPNGSTAHVRLTLLRTGGNAPVTDDFDVPANSRLTKAVGDYIARGLISPGEQVGARVDSLNGVPIVIERAMYWNGGGEFWGAGTGETGFKLK